jgi:hypothetical protein
MDQPVNEVDGREVDKAKWIYKKRERNKRVFYNNMYNDREPKH